MKQKDIGLIAVIAVISGVMSLLLSGLFLAPPESRSQSVEVVQPISSVFDRPSQDYFNSDAINPTQTIEIGEDANNKPFGDE